MNEQLRDAARRLTVDPAFRREDLLSSGLRRGRLRKMINIAARVLAPFSGAITTAIAKLFGNKAVQLLAAFVAGIGSISLIIAAYFSDGEIVATLTAASKYLSLRESVYNLVINPRMSDEERFDVLSELQKEYAR